MPFTVNRCLDVPNTGDLPNAWGTTAINPNMQAIDGALGGKLSLSLGAATTITLAVGAGSTFTPGAGPNQSDNALIRFSGTLSGNAIIKFTMPGFYIVHNACGSASVFSVKLSPSSGGGNSIGAPPGRKIHVFFDGTDMDYVNMPEVGSALDLSQNTTAVPVWMTACSVLPYLVKDGSVYSFSTYPALGQYLGSTFGGNGVSTFGVPDEMARVRVGVDKTGTGRITSGVSGVNAASMGAAGGDQSMQNHAHGANVNDPTHAHNYQIASNPQSKPSSGGTAPFTSTSTAQTDFQSTGITVDISDSGDGGSQNVMPCIVSCLPLIKT